MDNEEIRPCLARSAVGARGSGNRSHRHTRKGNEVDRKDGTADEPMRYEQKASKMRATAWTIVVKPQEGKRAKQMYAFTVKPENSNAWYFHGQYGTRSSHFNSGVRKHTAHDHDIEAHSRECPAHVYDDKQRPLAASKFRLCSSCLRFLSPKKHPAPFPAII
jgi:hypothetical protein